MLLDMLAHCIDTSKKAVILKVHNDYVPICIECLNEGSPQVREAALPVMAAITNVYLYFLITKGAFGHGEAGIAAILAKGQLLRQLDMGPTIVLMGRAAINMAFMDTLGVTMVCSRIGMSANYGTQLDTLRVTMERFDLVLVFPFRLLSVIKY
ncbi:hypothetical protein Tco_0904498 [Tanacetum coccineum]